MNRKEFTNLLLEWRENFINERGLPHRRIKNFTSFKRKHFPSLREKRPSIIPVTLVTFKLNKTEKTTYSDRYKIYKDIIAKCRVKGNDKQAVLENTEQNRQRIAKFLRSKSFIDEVKSNQILNSADTDIIIIPEEGDISGEINKDEIGNTIWSIHDLYHTYLQDVIEYSNIPEYNDDDLSLFCELVKQVLSTEGYPHLFDAEDSMPSVFAFLYLFIMEFDSQTNEFNIDKSNKNIDDLKVDLQNFDLSNYLDKDKDEDIYPYLEEEDRTTFINIDSLINTIKRINEIMCETLQQRIKEEKKKIILDYI